MKKLLKHWRHLNDRVIGINERNLRLVYPLNKREHFHLADDKILTKSILAKHDIPVSPVLGVISRVGDIEEKWQEIPRQPLAIKPARGSGGGGIWVLEPGQDQDWQKGGKVVSPSQIKRHLGNILFGVYSFGSDDQVLIEEKIEAHPFFTGIFPDGVADLRIIIKEGKILMAMLRVPTLKSGGRANLHQGAIGIGVDLESGTLSQGYDGKRHLTAHPDSGVSFDGLPLPRWEEALAISQKTYDAFPLGYLGIDIAYDSHRGPLVLEINVRPGLQIQNVNLQGLKPLIDS